MKPYLWQEEKTLEAIVERVKELSKTQDVSARKAARFGGELNQSAKRADGKKWSEMLKAAGVWKPQTSSRKVNYDWRENGSLEALLQAEKK